jgi:hypothetical protein
MVPGFPAFAPIYPTSGGLGPPPSPQSSHSQQQQHSSQQQQQQQQQQTIVITENPNIRKIRSASTENTMPEGIFNMHECSGYLKTNSARDLD